MFPTCSQIFPFTEWWIIQPEKQVQCPVRLVLSCSPARGGRESPFLKTAKRRRREQSNGSSWSIPISAPPKTTSHLQTASSSQRTEATHGFRLRPSFPDGRATGLSIAGLLWNCETLCKAAVTQRAGSCAQVWSPQGAQGISLSPSSSPGLSQGFQCITCGITAPFQVTVSVECAGQSPCRVQSVHLRKQKCCAETSRKGSFSRQMEIFVYLKLEPDSN